MRAYAECPALSNPNSPVVSNAGYCHNAKFREIMEKFTLGEQLKWNTELKVYTMRVHTAKQANDILAELRTLEGHEQDLPATVDATIFAEAKPAYVAFVPHVLTNGPTSHSQQVIVAHGYTYPVKSMLAEHGFFFVRNFNEDPDVNVWCCAASSNLDSVTADLIDKGWTVETFDGMAD